MRLILKKIFLNFSILLAIHTIALCQTKFTAIILPEQINKDEYATLRLVIENAEDIRKITPPSFKDFELVSGPNQESGMSSVNGVVNKYMAISYVLKPRHTGKIVLKPATANINGIQYSSTPLKLVVKNASGAGMSNNSSQNPFTVLDPFSSSATRENFSDFLLKKGESIPNKVSKNMYLLLQTSKTSCYVGEPIIASYKLYTRLKSESKLTKNPSFNGFSVIDLQQSDILNYGQEKLNGRDYNVYTIRKAQLYPLQDGTIELESATLENNIQFLRDDQQALQDNLDGFMNGFSISPDAVISETISLSSKPLTITVKPLPEAGKPASFNGAVGNFNVTTTLDRNRFATDETGKLTMVVSGAGNLQLITPPEIKWSQSIEVFEAKVVDELVMENIPVTGKKIFEIPFAVQTEGKYEIPAIEFTFFDPSAASYKTITTQPISFTVLKGIDKPNNPPAIFSEKKSISFAGKIFNNRGWIVAFIGLMMLLGLFFWIKSDQKKQPLKNEVLPSENEKIVFAETANLIPQNPLSLSGNCLNSSDCNNFYTLLNKELKAFLATQFSLQVQDVNENKIGTLMDQAGIDNVIALQMQQLIKDIEWQLYTPYERNDTMHELYNRTQSLIKIIHNYKSVTR